MCQPEHTIPKKRDGHFPNICFMNDISCILTGKEKKLLTLFAIVFSFFLIPRVLRLFVQRFVARRDSGVLEDFHRKISAVKQFKTVMCHPIKTFKCFDFPRVSPGDKAQVKESEDSGYDIDSILIFTYANNEERWRHKCPKHVIP